MEYGSGKKKIFYRVMQVQSNIYRNIITFN